MQGFVVEEGALGHVQRREAGVGGEKEKGGEDACWVGGLFVSG